MLLETCAGLEPEKSEPWYVCTWLDAGLWNRAVAIEFAVRDLPVPEQSKRNNRARARVQS